jgi:hypothetical protein
VKAMNGSSRMSSRPASIDGIVDRIIASLGLTERYHVWLMVSRWDEIVGEYYARKSRAFRFDDGTLYVAVEDPMWRQMMALDTEKILQIIHAYPHGRVVKSLHLVHGEKGTRIDAN